MSDKAHHSMSNEELQSAIDSVVYAIRPNQVGLVASKNLPESTVEVLNLYLKCLLDVQLKRAAGLEIEFEQTSKPV